MDRHSRRGWLNDDETIKHLGVLKKIYESTLDHLEPYTPEIAVIVDEKSSLYLGPGLQVSHPLLHVFRKEFYHAALRSAFTCLAIC